MKKVDIYTDGACSNNPGPGGFAAVLFYKDKMREISGYEAQTTNNRMELRAVIEGLRALKEECGVNIYSDSAYVVNAVENGWLDSWRKNGYKTAQKKDVSNSDLWELLYKLLKKHKAKFSKVKGHSDNEYNNRCDFLAREQIKVNAGI